MLVLCRILKSDNTCLKTAKTGGEKGGGGELEEWKDRGSCVVGKKIQLQIEICYYSFSCHHYLQTKASYK